ncbi:30S ribosome-binding factor RbfA [Enterococcus hirae]|jgi:ribosome-binding factor A|nr:30S ribosome-binding factor RbfA [Enterococcaceae bacterium]MCI1919560.1 30S ribosome-binding factor RbfA [Enterococcaceae bacterium]MDM8213431.1 30S ribosome-binding factor RbfA [Enterococcus hirae]
MAQYRDRRLAQEILREINDILRKTVKDPRVEGVNITDVRVTGDLQQATIYYSTLTDKPEDIERVAKGLEKAKGIMRKELGRRLRIYKTPEIFFERDESLEYGSHIDELLRNLHKD